MIHICDNFFSDPFKIRSIAFKGKYKCAINYPGVRSHNVPKKVEDEILSYGHYITKNSSLTINTPSFQSISQDYDEGIFHKDVDHTYICIIYLSLDPPLNSGTEICDSDHVRGLEIFNSTNPKVIKSRDLFHKDPLNLIYRYRYGRIRKKVNSFYKSNIIAANKFNRCVIFPATNFHRAQNFFGTSLGNSRLTIVSFMDKHGI
tara:strand:- start:73 stop:681 length:609 start_codon:yes stop_codon:yes gene_type:complete